jgi:hypothetical protein
MSRLLRAVLWLPFRWLDRRYTAFANLTHNEADDE